MSDDGCLQSLAVDVSEVMLYAKALRSHNNAYSGGAKHTGIGFLVLYFLFSGDVWEITLYRWINSSRHFEGL
jgi:hypothetical protein